MKVRIVEDTTALAVWLSDAITLSAPDVDVITTTGAFDRLLRPEPWAGVDVALVDIMLGGPTSGIHVLDYLHVHHPQIKRVAMTASIPSAEEVRASGLTLDVLIKPFDHFTLLRAIGVDPA